ncbi:unnamed protein product [Pleuronectes platessa]|uniref:Uncharacterized protein n=1 Tax=Pleuronectes platessa TaxID=8262 RepID=A0A9N7Z0J9_PLEPL|nr:unnamed protein product [Pleuronectes platessa]
MEPQYKGEKAEKEMLLTLLLTFITGSQNVPCIQEILEGSLFKKKAELLEIVVSQQRTIIEEKNQTILCLNTKITELEHCNNQLKQSASFPSPPAESHPVDFDQEKVSDHEMKDSESTDWSVDDSKSLDLETDVSDDDSEVSDHIPKVSNVEPTVLIDKPPIPPHNSKDSAQRPNDETEVSDEESEVSGEESEVSGDESEVSVEESEVSLEESEVSGEKSEVSGDESEVSGDESEVSVDELEISVEESEVSLEESEVSLDELEVSVERRQVVVWGVDLSGPRSEPAAVRRWMLHNSRRRQENPNASGGRAKTEQLGKGVALKSVTAFFTWLREAESKIIGGGKPPGDMAQ